MSDMNDGPDLSGIDDERCPYHGKAPTITLHAKEDRLKANGVYCALCAVQLSVRHGGHKYSDDMYRRNTASLAANPDGGAQ